MGKGKRTKAQKEAAVVAKINYLRQQEIRLATEADAANYKARSFVDVEKNLANNPHLMDQLLYNDVAEFIDKLLDQGGYFIEAESGKLDSWHAHDPKVPWVYVQTDNSRRCRLYRDFWNMSGIIPEKCMNCWKVVVRVPTLRHLLLLLEMEYEMQQDIEDCFCKCGIETRHWVPALYGGYFYTQSKEGGLERYQQVRERVDKKIGPATSVILKRACTEFELKDTDSSRWHKSKWAHHIEKLFFENCQVKKQAMEQPRMLKVHVMRSWIQFAFQNGDPTAVMFNNGAPLYTPSVTYHEEGISDGKKKMVSGDLQATHLLAK